MKHLLIAALCLIAWGTPSTAAIITGAGLVQEAMAPADDPSTVDVPLTVRLACEVAFFDGDTRSRLMAEGKTFDEALEHLKDALPEDGYCERLEVTASAD